jgi:hypothetical protein
LAATHFISVHFHLGIAEFSMFLHHKLTHVYPSYILRQTVYRYSQVCLIYRDGELTWYYRQPITAQIREVVFVCYLMTGLPFDDWAVFKYDKWSVFKYDMKYYLCVKDRRLFMFSILLRLRGGNGDHKLP